MIIYLASYPGSGNTLCRQLIKYYFERISTSIYQDSDPIHFEGEENFQVDSDERFKIFLHDKEHRYRGLIDNCQSLLTTEFRRELAQSNEPFFIKTHEPPFEEYFDGEFVVRVVRHPGAAFWSYYHFLYSIEQKPVTVDEVISGQEGMFESPIHWSNYTEAWLNIERELPDKCFKVRFEDLVQNEKSFIAKIEDWTLLPLMNPLGTFPNFDHWNQAAPKSYDSGSSDEWKDKLTSEQVMLIYHYHAEAMDKEGYSFDFAPPPYSGDYESRIHLAQLGMADVANIPKVEYAGQIIQTDNLRFQVMFNGVKVPADSYYGPWYSELIRKCKGHHEPQEEYVFDYIVNKAPEAAIIMELGSFWAFYSAWFLTHVKNSQAILVEPQPENIAVSLATLSLNNCETRASIQLGVVGERPPEFENLYLGGTQIPNYVSPLLSVDQLMELHSIEHVYVLHSDIQGAELKMLDGAIKALDARAIDYLVISTHSNNIHCLCLEKLRSLNYRILAEHDLFESYTYDGLIVACSDQVQDAKIRQIRRRSSAEWTWEEAAKTWANKEVYLEKHRQILQSGELRPAFERVRQERDRLLEEHKLLELLTKKLQIDVETHLETINSLRQKLDTQDMYLGHANEQIRNYEIQCAHMKDQLDALRADYEARMGVIDSLGQKVEAQENYIQSIRQRKIVKLMRRLGRPLT